MSISSKPKVTVITATTGSKYLKQCVESVLHQTYENIQHLVVFDGVDRYGKYNYENNTTFLHDNNKIDLAVLPYPTGTDRFNGHRIYGAMTYIAEGDYLMWLDDDNYLEPNHIESLVDLVHGRLSWAFSFRNIIDQDGSFVCEDNCESLGLWPSILGPDDFFIDVNCYFVRKEVALGMSPVWYRRFREPGVMEIDRAISHTLRNNNLKFDCTRNYTVNYRVGNTGLSVQKGFFIQGNEAMLVKYKGILPWKK